ncbi:MAG: TRAP transporter small permease subunit [Candidatus Eiseniibacteriota bacterium]
MSGIKTAADALDRVVDATGRVAAWLTLVLVLLMSTNVLLRYLFSIGSVAAQELEWHLLAFIVLFGMAYSLLHDGHLRVDVLYARLKPGRKRLVDFVSALLSVAFALVVIDLSWSYVMQSYSIGEGSPDPGGLPDRYLLKAAIPVGFFLLLLQASAETLRAGLALFSGHSVTRD